MAGETKTDLAEPDVIELLLKQRVVTEAQLKAALDFQKSVGGKILDILFTLGLTRTTDLDTLLHDAPSEEKSLDDTRESNEVLDPATVDLGDLKLHHRLLDKIPFEVVQKYLLNLFFPVSKACSRKLIVGHGKEVADEVLDKVKGLLGVEICSLEIPTEVATGFLEEYQSRQRGKKGGASKSKSTPPSSPPAASPAPEPEAETPVRGGDFSSDERTLLKALSGLLVKKRLITREELQVELELSRKLSP